MAVPVLIFLALNAGHSSTHGWGVAMSTDTAFALGLLAIVGRRIPDRVRLFLLTVSVVDDLVALDRHRRRLQRARLDAAADPRPGVLRSAHRRALAAGALRPGLRAARDRHVGLALPLRHRPGRRRTGDGTDDVRVRPVPRRARARHRPLPAFPRATNGRAGPRGPGRPGRVAVLQRPAAAALPPVDQLPDRAALRLGQRRHPDRRQVPGQGLHLADHARHHPRLRARQAGRRVGSGVGGDQGEPRAHGPARRLGRRCRSRRRRGHRLHRLDPHRVARLRGQRTA